MTPEEIHGQRSNTNKFRDFCNWFISLGKPSWEDSIEQSDREWRKQWYLEIPKERLDEAHKCLTKKLGNIGDIDSIGLWLSKECQDCRYQLFCEETIRSLRKAFMKYQRKEKTPLK